MPVIQPFAAYRPDENRLPSFVAPPYDVLSRSQARALAAQKPDNILHVTRPDIDFSDAVADTDAAIYAHSQAECQRLRASGVWVQDDKPSYYVLEMLDSDRQHRQLGLVACFMTDAVLTGRIKRHETTRVAKQADRVAHLNAHQGQVSPVLLAHPPSTQLTCCLQAETTRQPVAWVQYQAIQHTLWRVQDDNMIQAITDTVEAIPRFYIADGHHRCAAAHVVAQNNRQHAGKQWLLAALFSSEQLQILGYHRVVYDTPFKTGQAMAAAINAHFSCEPGFSSPATPYEYCCYLDHAWYTFRYRNADQCDSRYDLPADVLSRALLSPYLQIHDQRTDARIQFVGGYQAVAECQARVDNAENALAIVLHPTTMTQLMAAADRETSLSPKATWFEPKLIDGLFAYFYT